MRIKGILRSSVLILMLLFLCSCGGNVRKAGGDIVLVMCIEKRDVGCKAYIQTIRRAPADEEREYVSFSSTGRTVSEALSVIERENGLTLSLGSCMTVIVSDCTNKNEFLEILRELCECGINSSAFLFASENGGELFPEEETKEYIGEKLKNLLESSDEQLSGYSVKAALDSLSSHGEDRIYPLAQAKEGQAVWERSVIYNDSGRYMYGRDELFAATMLLHGKFPAVYTLGKGEKSSDIVIEKVRFKVSAEPYAQGITAFITAYIEGYMYTTGALETAADIEEVSRELSDELKSQIEEIWQKTSENGCDIFSVGRLIGQKHPKYLENYSKSEGDYLKAVNAKFTVTAQISDKRRLLG